MSESDRTTSTPPTLSREEAAAALRSAQEARASVAEGLHSPAWWDLVYGAGVGLFVGSGGVMGAGGESDALKIVAVLMAIGAAAVFGWLIGRWRALNGVWVSGYRPGRTMPTTLVLLVGMLGLYGGAYAAGAAGLGWAVALAVLAAAVGGALATRRWMVVYRAEAAEAARAAHR